MRDPYKTRQKELIEREIKKFKTEFTIKELFSKLSKKDQTLGLTTVYRAVNSLVDSHVLSKSTSSDGTLRYHVVEKCDHTGHCLLKCESCGKLTHVDCGKLNSLSRHFIRKHHFKINQADITIRGICENCKA